MQVEKIELRLAQSIEIRMIKIDLLHELWKHLIRIENYNIKISKLDGAKTGQKRGKAKNCSKQFVISYFKF